MTDNPGTAIPTPCAKCGADCADAHGWIGNQVFCRDCYRQTLWPEYVAPAAVPDRAELERKLAEAREIMQDCIENKALAEHRLVELEAKLATSERSRKELMGTLQPDAPELK